MGMLSQARGLAALSWRLITIGKPGLAQVKAFLAAPESERLAALEFMRGTIWTESGWPRSFSQHRAIDPQGDPIPWYCYPFLSFLADRLSPGLRVLEFGAGYSTLWWASRAESVFSIEAHAQWHAIIQPLLPGNAGVALVPDDGLALEIDRLIADGQKFDLVVIDNYQRLTPAEKAIGLLHERSVIIFDNSDDPAYQPAVQLLRDQGFHELRFHGMGPINTYPWSTSLLYRDGNLFGV